MVSWFADQETGGCPAVMIPKSEGRLSGRFLHVALDRVDIAFNDERTSALSSAAH